MRRLGKYVERQWPVFVGGAEDGGTVPDMVWEHESPIWHVPIIQPLASYTTSAELPESQEFHRERYRREFIRFQGSRHHLVVWVHEGLTNDEAGALIWEAMLAKALPAGEA